MFAMNIYYQNCRLFLVRTSSVLEVQVRPLVQGPNSQNCLCLVSVAFPFEKVIFVSDTNYVTSAIRKFMLGMASPGSFQNIVLSILAQEGSRHVIQIR